MDPESETQQTLLDRYAPELRYDSRELFAVCAVEAMTDNAYDGGPCLPYANALKADDGTEIASTGGDPPLTIGLLSASYPGGRVAEKTTSSTRRPSPRTS